MSTTLLNLPTSWKKRSLKSLNKHSRKSYPSHLESTLVNLTIISSVRCSVTLSLLRTIQIKTLSQKLISVKVSRPKRLTTISWAWTVSPTTQAKSYLKWWFPVRCSRKTSVLNRSTNLWLMPVILAWSQDRKSSQCCLHCSWMSKHITQCLICVQHLAVRLLKSSNWWWLTT